MIAKCLELTTRRCSAGSRYVAPCPLPDGVFFASRLSVLLLFGPFLCLLCLGIATSRKIAEHGIRAGIDEHSTPRR
jgi:hypothetical protein